MLAMNNQHSSHPQHGENEDDVDDILEMAEQVDGVPSTTIPSSTSSQQQQQMMQQCHQGNSVTSSSMPSSSLASSNLYDSDFSHLLFQAPLSSPTSSMNSHSNVLGSRNDTTTGYYRKPGDLITASLAPMQMQLPFPTTLSEALSAISPTIPSPRHGGSTAAPLSLPTANVAASKQKGKATYFVQKHNHSLERVDEMLDEILEMAETVLDENSGLEEEDDDDDNNDKATDGLIGFGLQDVLALPPSLSSSATAMAATMVTPPFPQARKRGSGTMMMMNNMRMDDDFIDPFDDVSLRHIKNNISSNNNKRARLGVPIGSLKTSGNKEFCSKEDEKIPFEVYSASSAPPPSMSMASQADSTSVCLSSMPQDKWRFRSYQYDIWQERFQELVEYRKKYGHCLVPHNWSGNVPLAQWVKRQRYQYKLLQEGKHSTMSVERMNILNAMGFVWDLHKVAWEEKFVQLQQYASQYGHCNVSGKLQQHRPLSIWVKCQRRQRKLMERNEKSTMTPDRIERLDQLGFDWNPRNL